MKQQKTALDTMLINRRNLIGGSLGAASLAATASLLPGLTAAQDAAVSGDISYWHHFTSDSEMVGLDQVIEAFGADYPDVNISPENIPNADYMTQFTTSAVAGSLPDTAMAAVDRIPDMLALGGLIDVTERFGSWESKDAVPAALMDGGTIDGMIYGLPMFLFVDWMYYRKDWFEEAGLDIPDTWDAFREAAIALTDESQGRFGFGLRGGDGGQGHVLNIMRAYGGLSVDDAGVPVIERDGAIEGVAFWAGLYTDDKVAPPSAPSDSYSQIMQGFRTGQTGMLLHHTGSLAEILGDLSTDQVGTMIVPTGPAMRVSGVAPLYNSICKADNEESAWAWLTQWLKPDVAIQFLETTGYFPASTEAANDQRVTDNPIYDAARENSKLASCRCSLLVRQDGPAHRSFRTSSRFSLVRRRPKKRLIR